MPSNITPRASISSAVRGASESQTFAQRAVHVSTPPLAAYIYRLMLHKQSNLALSADVQTSAQLLELAEDCGDSIVILKTHCDMVSDFSMKTVKGLVEIAARKKFLIFEDRKFGDIGNTVQTQYAAGPFKIATWASITNAHIFPGPAVITSLRDAAHSAIAALNSSFSTEIKGGADSYFESQEDLENLLSYQSRRSDDDEAQDDSELQGDLRRRSSGGLRASPRRDSTNPLDRRKSSVVSISTTISSSTEYISPPATSSAASPAGHPSYSFDPEKPPVNARGLLLLAQMSSADNLFTPQYTTKCLELARGQRDFVIGFIAQEGLNREPGDNFLVMTPGVSLPPSSSSQSVSSSPTSSKALPIRTRQDPSTPTNETKAGSGSDGKGQQYNTPHHVVLEKGCDVIIVGRGIINARDSGFEAERYRLAGWEAYCERVGQPFERAKVVGSVGRAVQR